jgi:hypothetical protein
MTCENKYGMSPLLGSVSVQAEQVSSRAMTVVLLWYLHSHSYARFYETF